MKRIYNVNIRMTGCNGGIINCIDRAYTDENKARSICDKHQNDHPEDPNWWVYVTGPILLDEEELA